MNRILLSIFAATLLFAAGHALQCYKCDIGIWNLCITSKVTCNEGEQCFSGEGKAVKVFPVIMKGCLKTMDCNKETSVPVFDNHTIYKMNKTCCAEDLCNAAPGLPVIAPFSLTLATLTASLVLTGSLV
ncbi:hypothetical protein AAFF_G00270690 [Aldrovandia affinis]|uniref:UPAR/Ly6 domain-containing protein n=1 Tax=Aldrovandia affinis TaxID=143900 RepID=A0AAD7RB63_9TELE|nr:hypothetical protein AAFF_G00270690 [Aldrovandia affinis]